MLWKHTFWEAYDLDWLALKSFDISWTFNFTAVLNVDSADSNKLCANVHRGTQNEDYYESPINKFKREENTDYLNLREVNNDETAGALKDHALNMMTSNEAEKENKISPAKEREDKSIPITTHVVHNPDKNW